MEKKYKSPAGMEALLKLQKEADEQGLTEMDLDEINAEITAVRKDRSIRKKMSEIRGKNDFMDHPRRGSL